MSDPKKFFKEHSHAMCESAYQGKPKPVLGNWQKAKVALHKIGRADLDASLRSFGDSCLTAANMPDPTKRSQSYSQLKENQMELLIALNIK